MYAEAHLYVHAIHGGQRLYAWSTVNKGFAPQGKLLAGPTHNEGRAALEMARLNVSKDEAYGEQGSGVKLERGIGSCKHSVLALSLSTLHTSLTLEVRCLHGCSTGTC